MTSSSPPPTFSPPASRLPRLRLPPRGHCSSHGSSEIGLTRRNSFTPRLGMLTQRLTERSRSAASESRLAYDPKSWLATFHLLALHQKDSFVLVPCVLLTLWAIALSAVYHLVPSAQEWMTGLPTYVPTVLGSTMGLLLAFRLNTAYARWWEARDLWGHTVLVPRMLLITLRDDSSTNEATATPEDEGAATVSPIRQLGGWLIAFTVALKHHLRSERLSLVLGHLPNRRISRLSAGVLPQQERRSQLLSFSRAADGTFSLLNSSQLYHLAQSKHPPLYALGRIHNCIHECLERCGPRHSIALESLCYRQVEALASTLTGCERILRTPLPPGYVGVLRLLVLVWLALLPLSLLDDIPFGTIPVTAFASYLLLEVEDVAVQVDNPFGEDPNDLPLQSYVLTCQAEVHRLLDEAVASASAHPDDVVGESDTQDLLADESDGCPSPTNGQQASSVVEPRRRGWSWRR